MKTFVSLATLGLATLLAATSHAAAPTEDHAAEMKECAICQFLAADDDLMKDMTMECHKVNDGMICMAIVPKDLKATFDAAHKKMMEAIAGLGARYQAGEQVKLCGFCQSVSDLIQAGATPETIEAATGSITLITSHDAAVVDKIHAQADKFTAEQEAAAK